MSSSRGQTVLLEDSGKASIAPGQATSVPRSLSADGSGWQVDRHDALLCKLLAQLSPDTECEVDIMGRSDFAMLWKRDARPDQQGGDVRLRIQRSMRSGPIVLFSPGAGKSGSSMSRSSDSQFKIKWGLRDSRWMSETDNLLKLLRGQQSRGAAPLSEHLRENPRSLLNRYLALVRVRIGGSETFALLMDDAAYGIEQKLGRNAAIVRYDLKGTSRNQKTMQTKNKQYTLINGDFRLREKNQLPLRNLQCKLFRSAARRDAEWLDAHNIIDYSFFVVIARSRSGCSSMPGPPFCNDANGRTTTVSIIDYLNDFNGWKKAESTFGKFYNYSGKMIDFSESVCPTNKEETIERWIAYTLIALIIAIVAGAAFGFKKYGAAFMFSSTPFEHRTPHLQTAPGALRVEMTSPSRWSQPVQMQRPSQRPYPPTRQLGLPNPYGQAAVRPPPPFWVAG